MRNSTASAVVAPERLPALWPWHLALALICYSLDVPLYLALAHLPVQVSPDLPWLLMVLVAGGTTCGLGALALAGSQWRHGPVAAVVLCGTAGIASDVAVTLQALANPLAYGSGSTDWLPALAAALGGTLAATLLPVLLGQGFLLAMLALVLLWGVVGAALAGTSAADGSPLLAAILPAVPWVLAVLCVAALGIRWIRRQVTIWRSERVHLAGAVLTWLAIRPVAALCLLAGLLAALPVAFPHWAALEQAWQHSLDPLRAGTFTSAVPGGAPTLEPGQPLPLDAQAPANAQTIVLRYQVTADTAAAPVLPPLVVATFSTFDGTRWTPNPAAQRRRQDGALASNGTASAGADSLAARVQIVSPLQGNYLPGFDSPVAYQVPGGADALVSGAGPPPTNLTVDAWQAATPLRAGATYTVSSAWLSGDAATQAALPDATQLSGPALDALLAVPALPTPLLATLRREVAAWTAGATTPVAKAQAIASAMQGTYKLDTRDPSPPGVAALQQMVATSLGGPVTWVTLHALLCRLAGVPVRLTEAFLPGAMDLSTGQRVVRVGDMTFYVQVATSSGWARVGILDTAQSSTRLVPKPTATPNPAGHPTPSTSLRSAHQGATPPPVQHATHTPPVPPLPSTGGALVLLLLFVLAICLLVVAVLVMLRLVARLTDTPQRRAWRLLHSLVAPARAAGVPTSPGDTPLGFARRLAPLLPAPIAAELVALAEHYSAAVYTQAAPPLAPVVLARAAPATKCARAALRSHTHTRTHAHSLSTTSTL